MGGTNKALTACQDPQTSGKKIQNICYRVYINQKNQHWGNVGTHQTSCSGCQLKKSPRHQYAPETRIRTEWARLEKKKRSKKRAKGTFARLKLPKKAWVILVTQSWGVPGPKRNWVFRKKTERREVTRVKILWV